MQQMKNLLCKRLAACLYMKQLQQPSLSVEEMEREMKCDWMLAAAVFDRICAIIFTIILVGGTAIFFLLFAFHP